MNASKKWGREAQLSGHTFWVRMSDEEATLLWEALNVSFKSKAISLDAKMIALEMMERIDTVVFQGKRMSANRRG